MNIFLRTFLIVSSFLLAFSAQSQILNPVKWSFESVKISEGEYKLRFVARIDKGWTVYSQYTSDEGPVPTSITYDSDKNITFLGKASESGVKKEGLDPFFDVNVIKFTAEKPFVIEQKIKVKNPKEALTGYVNFMACDHEKCLPPTDAEFSFTFDSGGASKTEEKQAESTVVENNEPNSSDTIQSTADTLLTSGTGPVITGDRIDQKIASLVETYQKPLSACGGEGETKEGVLWTFIFGFIGGLLALLTPCVFPMLPITISFFTKDTKRKGWVNGLIYGASIIIIYVLIGLLITIFVGPEALNRLSTNWIANTLFFLIFIAFAFSFFGYYEITLPSSWSTGSDRLADKGGLLGIFFMAFTLALVSFSCTGPIIGTAIVQAATKGEYMGPFLVMFGFSLALALPFGLFAAFPAWLNSLPKSGSWMNSVKVVLGFVELALALKFLSVADMTNGWDFLKYELFMGLWIVIFALMTAYLFGFISFPHDSPLKKLSVTRTLFGLSGLALVLYLGTGFRINEKTGDYHALALMSGLAPPAHYNFLLEPQSVDEQIKSRYPSYGKCANNINCFKDYFEGISYAREVNKPVMIDFTGHGCVNCRKTEEHIWVDDRIRSILNDSLVLISLYVDDDKKLEQIYLSEHSGKKIRNVGNKWADFQIVNFQQNSQPLYVMATNEGQVISKPRPFRDGVEDYLKFLTCSLTENNNIQKSDTN
jgi:thiol:disulfide interchange protein